MPARLTAFTLAVALAGAAAASAQGDEPAFPHDCGATTADLRYLPFKVGSPVKLAVIFGLRPECGEEPGDPRAATLDWGDGSTSQGMIAPRATPEGAPPTIVVTGRHVYRRKLRRGFPITVTVTNGRSGVVLRDQHYVAVPGSALPKPRRP